jgi:hydroxymethylbilane synthase
MKRLVVATRKSQLALAQSRAWMATLRERGTETEELHVVTTGDREQSLPLNAIGGKGLFLKEIEEALCDGRADVAVHSMKDVPGELADGLCIGCVPMREDPRDVIVTRSGCSFDELPAKSRLGTSSLRRLAQLKKWRPDLDVVPIRGNVDTRLRKCSEGVVDAVVLALAGLKRLGLADVATEVLEPDRCLPAIGQGALAIEQRAADRDVTEILRPLIDSPTEIAVFAERGVMVAAEGSCQIPIAGFARRVGDEMLLSAMLADPDGSRPRFVERRAAWPADREEAFAIGLDAGRELKGS